MKVKTTHPITGKTKIVEMTADEYRANKILNPGIRVVEDERELVDESGCRWYTYSEGNRCRREYKVVNPQ